MKTPTSLLPIIILAIVTLNSCNKKDTASAKITIESPNEGVTYNEGEEMMVKINFKSDDDLHNIAVYIDNTTEGGRVFSTERHLHVKTLNINAPFTPTVNGNSVMKLVAMTTDHDGNHGSKKEITFNVRNINSDVNPEITITRPGTNENFSKGQLMPIQVLVSHQDGLLNANLKVIRIAGSNNTTVLDYTPTFTNNTTTYSFDTAHVLDFSGQHVDFEVRVTVTGINNRTTTRSVFKHVH